MPLESPSPQEIPSLEERVQASPTDAQALLRLGAAYLEADRPEDARGALETAASNAPDNALVRFYLGVAYEELEMWDEARAALEEVVATSDARLLRDPAEERLQLIRRRALEAEIRASLENEEVLADRPPSRGTVAVYPFRFSGDDESLGPLGTAIAELVVSDLSQVDRITVLERLRVQLLLDEMDLAEEGYVDPATAARSGRLLGAEQVVQGSIDEEGDRLDVLAGLVRIGTDEEPDPVADTDALQNFLDLEKRVVLALFESMGVELTAAERERVLERPTESLDALVLFGRALEAEDRGEFATAAALFEEALAEDPGFEEARTGTQRATSIARANAVSPLTVAARLHPELPPPALVETLEPIDYAALQTLIPAPGGRDPVAEVLGREGLRPTSAIIEIIVRPPDRED